jgi:hypothetical protein
MADRADRRFYEFGCFRLDAAGRVLFRGDQVIPLPPKAAETLLLLVQNAGNVVEIGYPPATPGNSRTIMLCNPLRNTSKVENFANGSEPMVELENPWIDNGD